MALFNAGQVVVACLGEAASQNPDAIKQAEERLKEWEAEPGFYTTLLNIFGDHGVDVNIRWQAVLYFKNGVDRSVFRITINSLLQDEKEGRL